MTAKRRGSVSFSSDEIRMLDSLLSTLMRGGDARVIARSPSIANVRRKFAAMKAAIVAEPKEVTEAPKPALIDRDGACAECGSRDREHAPKCSLWVGAI